MAALDPKQVEEFKKLLEELNKKKKQLNQDPILDLDATVENLGVVNELLDTTNENINDLNSSVEGIKSSWVNIVNEIKNVNETSGRSVSSFNKLSSIADKLSMSQKGLNELSSRQISSLVTKTKIEAENLKFQQKQLTEKQKAGTISEKEEKALKEIEGTLGKNNGLIKQQINALKTQEKQTRNVERATGLTGAAMKGISGFMDKIGMSGMGGVFEDANLAAKATAQRLTDGGKKAGGFLTKVRAMGSAFKVVGKAILRNLTDPLVVAGLAIKAMKKAVAFVSDAYKQGEQAAFNISEENVNMARSLGISQKAANSLAGSVAGMGPTTAASKKSIEGIMSAMGSTEKLSRNTARVFVKLNTMAGMSAESLAKFQKFAKKSGEDAGTLVSQMAKTAGSAIKNNKLAMTQRDLLEESADQSAYVKLQFAGQGPALVNAVAQSKALGLNMKAARDMASSLLNFEDSIAKEMEAELLIGKDLNLEEARALALKGDNVGAAKAIAEQVGSAADFMSLNVIAQQSLAEAAGMSVDEMSNMLSGQQDMESNGKNLVKDQEKGIAAMTSQVSLREDAENRARRAAEANISVYRELKESVHAIEKAWTDTKKVINDAISEEVIKPMAKFLMSKEGKEFLKKLPGYVKSALKGIKDIIKAIAGFTQEHPWLTGLAVGAVSVIKLVGFDKLKDMLSSGASAIGKFAFGNKQGAAAAIGIDLGTDQNPMTVKQATEMNVGDLIGNKGKASVLKQFKTLLTKPKVMFRALRMKGSGFGKVIGQLMGKFGKFGSLLGGLGSKLVGLGSSLKSGFGNVFKNIKSGLSKVFSSGGGGAKAAKAAKGGGNIFSRAFNSVKKGLSSAGRGIAKVAGKVYNAGKSAVKYVGKGLSKLNPVNMLKSKVGSGIAKGMTKLAGPALAAVAGFMDIQNEIGVAKMQRAEGKSVDTGKLGKRIIQKGAYPIAQAALNLIPGVGTLVMGADFILDMFGISPLRWLVNNLVDLVPDKAFKGLGQYALGKQKKVNDGIINPKGGIVMQGEQGTIQLNKNDSVIAGTNLFGGGKGDDKVVKLLERLITAVEKGGDVVLDGQKVGDAMAVGSYRMQ